MATRHMLRAFILNEVRKSLVGEVKAKSLPTELAKITNQIPSLTLKPIDGGWTGVVKVSEKRQADQSKIERAWKRLIERLSSDPRWSVSGSAQHGWNAQTDTGPNYAGNSMKFISRDAGIAITLSSSVSFASGTKTWTLVAKSL